MSVVAASCVLQGLSRMKKLGESNGKFSITNKYYQCQISDIFDEVKDDAVWNQFYERIEYDQLTGSDCLGRSMYDEPRTSALADKESSGAGGVNDGISTMTGVCKLIFKYLRKAFTN